MSIEKDKFIKSIFKHQEHSSKQRKHNPPEYTLYELRNWFYNQENFNELYQNYINNNKDKWLAPSVDRLDNSKGYSFDNIQLVTFLQNCENAWNDTRYKRLHNPKLLNGGHVSIEQFTLQGKHIASYISISEASRQLNIKHQGISRSCNKQTYSSNGFLWCYTKDKDTFILNIKDNSKKAIDLLKISTTQIEKYSTEGILLHTYNTLKAACIGENVTFKPMTKWLDGIPTPRKKQNYIFKRKHKYELN